ncbi:leucine-rich repeat domain-containing protein [Saccharothrix sp. HUAS TT1]|uniref:leucine-rich repeat domain-containing protein n=1 Tax=unclassified Saccharothrix TaxID=2593673 RepID=UPI00345C5C11
MADDGTPRATPNRFADAVGPASDGPSQDRCDCLGLRTGTPPTTTSFHRDRQDVTAAGWLRLLRLVDEAAADGRAEFAPFTGMSAAERRQVVTLPAAIAKLTAVKRLVLYGTNLVRVPPEIGAMSSLEVFDPYTSYRLHWYPYELTRCARLANSTVSTRALYGNFKFRPPFPALRPVTEAGRADLAALDPGVWGATAVRTCSVCDGPVRELRQVWISGRVGTDVLPLLVNACSAACVAALPEPARDHVPTHHTGGPDVVQPDAGW